MEAPEIELLDLHPPEDDLLREALAGLRSSPKTLPPKLFYDERGSELFEAICELPEYYLTRTEVGILERHLPSIAAALGPRVQVFEPGSGAGTKTRLLLGALEEPVAYVPMDICLEPLRAAAQRIAAAFPQLQVQALCADFLRPFEVPQPARPARRRVVYFPGSSIGNFHPAEVTAFLDHLAGLVGPGGGLLLGFDLRKDERQLLAAYDDARGVTAAFNRNVLRHLNRIAGADFDPQRFAHEAVWNEQQSRIEMHLVSAAGQEVRVGGEVVRFAAGESIRTECCYKFGPDGVAGLTRRFDTTATWYDDAQWFGIQLLEVR